MKKVPHTNNTGSIKHVGPVSIWPGETREVDPRDLHDESKIAKAAELQGKTVDLLKGFAAEISEAMPACSEAELVELKEAESEALAPRADVLAIIAAELLRRSDDDNKRETTNILQGSVTKISEALPACSDDELETLEAAEVERDKPRQGVVDAIAAERLRRASGDDD